MPIDISNKEEKQIALTGTEIEETLLQAHLSKDAIAKIKGLEASASEIDNSVMMFNNAKNYGVIGGDNASHDTPIVLSLLESIKSGGELYFPAGIYKLSSELLTLGDWQNVGNIKLRGQSCASVVDLRTTDYFNESSFNAINQEAKLTGKTILMFTTPTGNGIVFDGVRGEPSDFSKALENISISNLSIVGNTSGTLLKLLRTFASQYTNITIKNSGSGKALEAYDQYQSSFKRVYSTATSRNADSIGLHYDTYNGYGGMATFEECWFLYAGKGIVLGSSTAGATKYGGLESTLFKSCQVHECNINLEISSPVGTKANENLYFDTDSIKFESCYFELAKDKMFLINGGKTIKFENSTLNMGDTQNGGFVLSGDSNQSKGLKLILEECNISSPTSSPIFKVGAGMSGQMILDRNTFVNNGNKSFTFDDITTNKLSIKASGNRYRNWLEGLFFPNDMRRFFTSESRTTPIFTLTNTNLDCSGWVAPPAYVIAESYSAGCTIQLPTNLSILVEGCEIEVRRVSSSNTVTLDAGTGNLIYIGGTSGQTYSALAYPNKIKLKCKVVGTTTLWYDI